MLTIMALVLMTFVSVVRNSESVPVEPSPPVLVVTLDSIHRVTPPAPLNLLDKDNTLAYGRGYVKTIDYDYTNKTFCYIHPTWPTSSEFVCASVDNFTKSWVHPSPTLFPSQRTVTVMARDWVSGAWYFADKYRCVYVCDPSLQNCRILHTDAEEPLGLAVDPTTPGFLFWSQNNTSPSRLMRSSLAGDDVTGLLNDCSGPCTPKALTLDVINKLVYWIEGDEVAVSNYDGTGRRSVYKILEAYNRDIKAFSVLKSTLYMPGYRSLMTVDLENIMEEQLNTTETYTNMFGFPSVALVYHGSRQPPVSHPCMENKGGCDHICVTAYLDSTPVARCLCKHGFQQDEKKHGVCNRIQLDSFLLLSRGRPAVVELRAPGLRGPAAPAAGFHPTVADVDISTKFIYFSDSYLKQIVRQKLDGTERAAFIRDGLYEVQGLAVDWMGGNLYWTDEPLGRLTVARLSDPTQRRELIKEGSYHPYSIVLDPQRDLGRMSVARLSNPTQRRELFKVAPNFFLKYSIVLDPKRGVMYWSVWARGPSSASIETAHMNGSERRTLVTTDLELPNGLVLDTEKQVIYWCDTKLNKIESLELENNKRSTILEAPNSDINEPYGLVLVDGDIMWSEQNTGRFRRLSPNGTVTTVDTVTPPLYDIRMVSKSGRIGSNACTLKNGGCEELCLATPGGRTCACAVGRMLDPSDPSQCVEETPRSPPK